MPDVVSKEEGSLRLLYLEHTGYPFEHERMAKEVDEYIGRMNLVPYGSRMIMVFNEPEAVEIDRWQTAVERGVIGLLEPGGRFHIRDFTGLVSLGIEHTGSVEELRRTYAELKTKATAEGRGVQPFWRILFRRTRDSGGALIPKTVVQLFVGKCG